MLPKCHVLLCQGEECLVLDIFLDILDCVFYLVVLDFVFYAFHSVLEAFDSLADAFHQLRNFPSAEKKQDNECDDENFSPSE